MNTVGKKYKKKKKHIYLLGVFAAQTTGTRSIVRRRAFIRLLARSFNRRKNSRRDLNFGRFLWATRQQKKKTPSPVPHTPHIPTDRLLFYTKTFRRKKIKNRFRNILTAVLDVLFYCFYTVHSVHVFL